MNRASISTAALMLLGCLTLAPQAAALRVSSDTIPLALAPLGNEHRSLRASFNAVLQRATAPAATRADRLALVTFLRNTLIPYAQSEELVLYPVIDSALGTQGQATAALVRDHRIVATKTLELAALVDTDVPAFQREAPSLAALVEQHFSNEEDSVLPTLARTMNARALHALLARLAAQRVQ
jgi:hemerythrin HHE cation binding domain-containing protein